MTPSILALNLTLSFAALAALCLSQHRHHAEILGSRPGGRRVFLLRVLGWLGIALSLLLAGYTEGWAFGSVQWIGALTGAGFVLVLLLSYKPRLVAAACAAACLLTVTGAFLL